MLAVVRLLLMAIFVITSTLVGLVICLFRPFHADNVVLFGRWYAWCGRIFGVEVEVRRHPDVPSAQPCVFAANHQNNYDLFLLPNALLQRTVTIGKKSLRLIPFFGQLYWLSGNILLDRDNRSRAVGTMQGAVERIQQEQLSVWMFPEGTRSYGRGLLPFKTGAFHIAQQAKVPVVPVCMSSTQHIRLNRWRNGKVIIEMMAPVELSERTPIRPLARQVREQMQEKLAELDTELASDYTAQSLTARN